MPITVKDKVIIITGAGQGIGRAYAETLAAEGAKVVIAELNFERAKEVEASIKAKRGEALAVRTDVSKAESTREMVRRAGEKYGRVDVLVNNAAAYYGLKMTFFPDLDEAEFDSQWQVNVKGLWQCCKAVLPQMIKQGKGKIINIASTVAWVAPYGMLHYIASKGAVLSMTRALAKEVAELGGPDSQITVNTLVPGITWTDATVHLFSEQPMFGDMALETQILKHRLMPEDLVGAMLFMCSDACDFMTGSTVVVDGGMAFDLTCAK